MRSLTKHISPLAAWGLSFGYAVGWGSFVMPGTSFLPGAGPVGTLIGVLIGGFVMSILAWNYHTLVRRRAASGGAICYVQDAFGADYSYLVAWSLILAYLAILWANATAMAFVSRHALGDLLHCGFHYQVAGFDIYLAEAFFCVAVMLAAGALCLFGKRMAVRVNLALVLLFFCGIVVFFAVAAFRNPSGVSELAPAFSPLNGESPSFQVMHILSMMPWAFVGFEAISNSSAEFRFNTHRTFAVMFAAVAASAIAYAMLALLPVLSLPEGYSAWPAYIKEFGTLQGPDSLPTLGAAHRILGKFGAPLFFAMMFAASLTGIICAIVATSRLLHGLAEDGVLPSWFGRLDGDGNPRNAIVAVVAGSIAVPFVGRTAMGWPIDVSSIGAAIVYCFTSAAAFKFARKHRDRLTQLTGIVGGVLSVVFCLLLLVPTYLSGSVLSAESYLVMALWCLLGFIIYRSIFKHHREKFGHAPVVWIGVLVLIFFSTVMWCRQMTKGALNDSAHLITGFYEERRSHIVGMNLSPAAVEKEHRFMADCIADLNEKIFEYDFVEVSLLALALGLIFSLYRTQQYREKSLELAKVKAEQSNRAKSSFLSNMSHDIRTPMNAIIGYTELARRKGVTETMLREYLRKIEASSHHLLALINDVLEMSRIESGKMELEPTAIDLAALLEEVHDMFATATAVKKIDMVVDASRLVRRAVMCDKNRLNRVLLNLVSNAIKFTPEGGRIVISAEQLGDTDRDDGLYELRVKDTGIGMSQKFAAHVFEAFERENTSTVSGIQGTGLGMAITKNIVELMKGDISVKTEQGKGTEFTIRIALPFADEDAVKSAATSATATAGSHNVDFSSMRLLLVDDNEINREIAMEMLSDAGFTVDAAENGQVAVEKVAQGGVGFYDAVLMDAQMPVMNGYEATRTIRAMNIPGLSDIPIIALSANAFESDVKEALAAGMNAHLAKPFKIAELTAVLATYLGERGSGNGERGTGNGEREDAAVPHPPSPTPATSVPHSPFPVPPSLKELQAALSEIGCDVKGTIEKTFMGNEAFYMKMLRKLPANTAIGRMRDAFAAEDPKALFEASHELKGVYASLGLTPLYELCSEIVETSRAGGLDGVGDALQTLEGMHAEVVELAK